MKVLYWIALVLVVVGALNWGLVGLFQFDLVNYLCVDLLAMQMLANAVYVVVAVSGVWVLVSSFMCCEGGCSCSK
ncbi:DUF378 domain-containing protein [Candidatus Gracilibacteria bacterium]|jgi:hypothetical protein|nr:DUF378 domain-containing protein [Candidatus Gracilibacteria bacterium]